MSGDAPAQRGDLADRTERLGTPETGRESEVPYRRLFDELSKGFCIIEVIFDADDRPVDYRFLEINPAFEKQTGLHDARGRLMRDLAPDHEAHWFEIYGRIARTGEPERFVNEARALHRWYEVSAYRFGGAASRKVAVLFSDVTEAKRAEVALRESERRERERAAELEALLDAMPTPVFIASDPDCVHIVGNRAADELLRLPRGAESSLTAAEAARPRHFKVLHDGREMRGAELPAQRAARGFAVDGFEETIVFDDGTTREMLAYATPLLDDDQRPRGSILILVDITERKRVEKALCESEANFRAMANAMSQLAWIARPDGHIFWYNQRWFDYTGTTPAEMEGWGWQSVHHPAELPRVIEGWKASIATGELFEMVFPLRGADGSFRSFLTRAFPLKNPAGHVEQWFGTNTDIEDIKRAEEALADSRHRLEGIVGSAMDAIVSVRRKCSAARRARRSAVPSNASSRFDFAAVTVRTSGALAKRA